MAIAHSHICLLRSDILKRPITHHCYCALRSGHWFASSRAVRALGRLLRPLCCYAAGSHVSRGQHAVPVLAARPHAPSCSRQSSAGAGDSRGREARNGGLRLRSFCGLRPNTCTSASDMRRRPTPTPPSAQTPTPLRASYSHHHSTLPPRRVQSICHFHRTWPTLHFRAPADDPGCL